MDWNKWIRQVHRWMSMIFTMVVAAIFIALGIGKQPAEWVYFLPLFPLALLLPTAYTCLSCRMPSGGAARATPADRSERDARRDIQ